MGLKKYQQKRTFHKTPEPKGKKKSSQGKLVFVIQQHQASHLHYDFRLELGGVLKSWAVPKGPSMNPADKRMAMMVEDHPYDYRTFEGHIPKGNYGAGSVIVWDEGTYESTTGGSKNEQERVLRAGLHKGDLKFIMHGQKLKGEFALVKMKSAAQENAWLLIKKKDVYATDQNVLHQDASVKSGRTLLEIADPDSKRKLQTKRPVTQNVSGKKGPMPRNVKPMLATLTDEPFDKSGWLFEVKWDGYRAIAEVDRSTGSRQARSVKLYSRNGVSFNQLFSPLVKELSDLGHRAVLDGEVVVVDEKGRGQFQLLQNYARTGEGKLVYYLFDILYLDGYDLRMLPLRERQRILKETISDTDLIKISLPVRERGRAFFKAAQKEGLEGIIAKDGESQYKPGIRSTAWLKIKTHLRQEAVIVGYTEPRGGRKHFGALVLGVYEGDELVYIGHTGGGFNSNLLKDVLRRLEPLRRERSAFADPPKTNAPVTWVKPKLVCDVSFQEWTSDGSMRQPIFEGLRLDKKPQDVKRELPTKQKEKPGSTDREVTINKRVLKLTNLDKVFWPKDGYTKGDVIEYYRSIAKVILPYLKDRPESLHRHPNGIAGESFFQKDVDHQPPSWAKTKLIYSESNGKGINYLVCNDEATLVYMANLGCIELNPWNSRTQKLEYPDYTIMDLDPEKIGFDAVIETAQVVHEILERVSIPNYCKTSGASGLHICIPLGAKYTYDQAKEFTHIIALLAHQQLPKVTSVERSPAKRQRKVYLDYLQNRKGQTLASVYCIRPKPGAPVSAPLEWNEVKPGLDPGAFTIETIFKRLEKKGDLWKPVVGKGIDLKKAITKLAR